MRDVRELQLKAHYYEILAVERRNGFTDSEAESRALTQMDDDPLAAGLTGMELRRILSFVDEHKYVCDGVRHPKLTKVLNMNAGTYRCVVCRELVDITFEPVKPPVPVFPGKKDSHGVAGRS